MAHTLIRAGRLMAAALAAYLAAGCATSIQDEKPQESALVGIEAPSQARLAEVQLRVGRDAYDQGNLETALDLFEKAHESAPELAEPLIGKGDTLFAQRRFNAAEAAYRAALLRQPASFEAREGLGKTLVTLKKFKEGLRAFEAARAIREDATLLNKIGVTYELMGNAAAAQEHFRAALAVDQKSLTARNNLALSLAVSGSYDAALSEMEQVVADPNSSERHHANLAFIYGLAGRSMDLAPAKAVQAAANKGWDEDFFARTREIAKTGDRAAILDLLNNRAAPAPMVPANALPTMQGLPETPETLETREMPAASVEAPPPAAAPTGDAVPVKLVPPPPPAPAEPLTPDRTVPETDAARETVPEVTEKPAGEPRAGEVAAPPEQNTEQTPAETAALVVPPPPAAPAEMTRDPQPAPDDRLVMRAPQDRPAEPAAPAQTTGTATHHVQLGAWPTRWLGRAVKHLAEHAGDVLPAGRIEVVRAAKFHTLRSAAIADLAEARRICTTLRTRNIECFVTRQSSPPPGQGFDIASARDPDTLALFLASVEPIAPMAAPAPNGPESAVAALHPDMKSAAQTASGEFRLQFAAYRRPQHLRRGIDVLRRKAGDLLPALESLVRTETKEGTAIPYRLRSAPLESRAAADALCKSLSEKGVECLVIRHGAQAWLSLS